MERSERDRRVRQTREAIVGSFNDLVVSRPYDKVRVADVIDDAGVGRSMFYEHFRGKDELLRSSMSGILGVLADTVGNAGDPARVRWVLEHFWENRKTARAMIDGPGAAQVARELADQIEARLLAARDGAQELLVPARLAAAQIAGAQVALLAAWLTGLERASPADLAVALARSTAAQARAFRSGGTSTVAVGREPAAR